MESEDLSESINKEFSQLDICGGSIFHHLFTRPTIQKETFMRTYLIPWVITAFLFYGIPLIVVLVKVPDIIIRKPDSGLIVGFLDDWNMMFLTLVSLPGLVILTLSERSMVPQRIKRIISERVTSRDEKSCKFVSLWNKRYKFVNIFGQLAGIVVVVIIFYANYRLLSVEDYPGWQVSDGKVNAAGWIYLCWQIIVFFWIISIYSSQGLATIALLFSLTRHFKIKILPFHHDNCCGLKDVSYIGLRNQYLLAVVGMNLLVLFAVDLKLGLSETAGILVAGFVAYVTLGPVIFIGPLLPFRKSMLLAKQAEQAKVATQLQDEYTRIMQELEERSMAKKDEEMIDRLQKLKELVSRIPVWPFDTSTLRRFLTVYIFPLLTALVSILISYLIKVLGEMSAT